MLEALPPPPEKWREKEPAARRMGDQVTIIDADFPSNVCHRSTRSVSENGPRCSNTQKREDALHGGAQWCGALVHARGKM